MVGWHHRLNGHGFGWTQGVDDGQGGMVCRSSWGCKELDTTERLTELNREKQGQSAGGQDLGSEDASNEKQTHQSENSPQPPQLRMLSVRT